MPTGDRGEDLNDDFIYRKNISTGAVDNVSEKKKETLQFSVKLCWDIKDIKVL